MFQLLNESEATVMRLTEQAKVLKEEIRRQERNQERETAVSNMEYLKNIVFKVCIVKAMKLIAAKAQHRAMTFQSKGTFNKKVIVVSKTIDLLRRRQLISTLPMPSTEEFIFILKRTEIVFGL